MTLELGLYIFNVALSYIVVGLVCFYFGRVKQHQAAFRRGLQVGLNGATDLLSDIKREMGDGAYLFMNAMDRASLKAIDEARRSGVPIPISSGMEQELRERLAKRDGTQCSPNSH